jgi:transposase
MSKKNKKSKKKAVNFETLTQLNLNAAGIDIGSEEIWVSIPSDRDDEPVRCFESFTPCLHELASWLVSCRIDTVAMESTGVYWIPLYDILEKAGIEVYLVNAHHVKNVPGRKSDIEDCQWLQQLHTYGLLHRSFIPEKSIRKIRDLDRHRGTLNKYRSAHIQHMQKAMHIMNIQLDNVISDITGNTGMKIIRSIIKGERDPKKLATYRDRRCKNDASVIEKSLQGNYEEEYIFQLKQAVELYDYYTQKMIECDREMEKYYQSLPALVDPDEKPMPPAKKDSHSKNTPDFDLRSHLYRITGVDLTQVPGLNALTVQNALTETGADMNRFPTDKHLTSWLRLAPNQKKSGGKVLSSKTLKTKNRANLAFRQAAQSLHHSKSALGAYYRRMQARLGAPKAITATAHKLARIYYHMLKEQKEYVDLGEDYYIEKNKQLEIKRLYNKALKFGFYMTPIEESLLQTPLT